MTLTSERDVLAERVAALEAELKDAASRHAPPVELLPFARRVLELSSHAGSLPPAELQSSLMRLAIDAITQAEGAAPAAVATPPAHAPNRSQKPATTPAAPVTATALPTTQPTQQTTTQPQPVNAPAPENVTPVEDQTPDGKNGQDVNTSAAPPAEKNRNTVNCVLAASNMACSVSHRVAVGATRWRNHTKYRPRNHFRIISQKSLRGIGIPRAESREAWPPKAPAQSRRRLPNSQPNDHWLVSAVQARSAKSSSFVIMAACC